MEMQGRCWVRRLSCLHSPVELRACLIEELEKGSWSVLESDQNGRNAPIIDS